MPTAEPTAARTNPILLENVPFSFEFFTIYSKFSFHVLDGELLLTDGNVCVKIII